MKSQMAELLECFELPSVIWSLGWQGANSETDLSTSGFHYFFADV